MSKHCIQLYEGNGKGKTTAAVGAAVRMAGSGGNVLFCQFLKSGTSSVYTKHCNSCFGYCAQYRV